MCHGLPALPRALSISILATMIANTQTRTFASIHMWRQDAPASKFVITQEHVRSMKRALFNPPPLRGSIVRLAAKSVFQKMNRIFILVLGGERRPLKKGPPKLRYQVSSERKESALCARLSLVNFCIIFFFINCTKTFVSFYKLLQFFSFSNLKLFFTQSAPHSDAQ